MTKRVRIVVNPSAGGGRARRSLERAGVAEGARPDVNLEIVESRSPEHLCELVRAAEGDPLDALGLAGGDGTVTLALAALRGRNRVPIGILPVGSGNDFANHLGVPRTIAGALTTLLEGTPRDVDCARVISPGSSGILRTPSTAEDGARYCCVASLGLDELALRIVHGSRLPRSKALNLYASLRGLMAYQPRALAVSWEGGSFEGEVMFAAITNTRSYAGGFTVSPGALLDDGRLDLCIVKRTARTRLLANFHRILDGTHDALPEVVLASSAWFRVEAPREPINVSLDGELPLRATPVEITCEPAALRVLAPKAAPAP